MFKGNLYSEQKPAAEFLCNRRRVLLGWEQGTGKTVISSAAVDKLFDVGKAKRCLVLCEAAYDWQWEDKIHEFTDRPCRYITAKDKSAREYKKVPTETITLTNYSLFRNDFERIIQIPWDIVIADEAEIFSNTRSKTRKLLLLFNREVNPIYRWALTGTGITKRLEQLYSILYWVDKNFLPPWPDFEEKHIVRDDFKRITGYKNLKSLNVYIQNRVSRKTHKDMEGKLPKLLPKVHYLEKTNEYKEQEEILLEALETMVKNLKFDKDGNPVTTGRSVKAARALTAGEKELLLGKCDFAFDLTRKIYDENEDNRQLFFCRLKEPLAEIQELCKQRGIPTHRFTGDETSRRKRDEVKRFKVEGGVLLTSNAGVRGLDLPFANYVTHLDVPKSFGNLDQRNKRATRAGAKHKSVVVNYLITRYSMEHYFFEQIQREGDLHSAVFEGTADEVVVKSQSLRQFLKQYEDTRRT